MTQTQLPRRRPARRRPTQQHGFLLLEVLVALLIFAIGVLSLVGLQAASVKQSGEAKFRADASLLADDLIGRMWVGDRTAAVLAANFEGPDGAGYQAWLPAVRAALPGVGTLAALPVVTVVAVPGGAGGLVPSSLVTVVISWKSPNEPGTDPAHDVTVVTQIK